MVYGGRGIDPQWLWEQMLPDWMPELPSVERAEMLAAAPADRAGPSAEMRCGAAGRTA
jgi:hypothetical protein